MQRQFNERLKREKGKMQKVVKFITRIRRNLAETGYNMQWFRTSRQFKERLKRKIGKMQNVIKFIKKSRLLET